MKGYFSLLQVQRDSRDAVLAWMTNARFSYLTDIINSVRRVKHQRLDRTLCLSGKHAQEATSGLPCPSFSKRVSVPVL